MSGKARATYGPIKKVKIITSNNNILTGESFEKLYNNLGHLTTDEKKNIKKSSIEILRKCIPSSLKSSKKSYKNNNNTGLIIGKIQSGKTLSFTSDSSMFIFLNFLTDLLVLTILSNSFFIKSICILLVFLLF